MGEIKKTWFSADRKKEMLKMVEGAQRQGVSMRQSCKMLIIQRRRVLRWFEHQRDGQGLVNGALSRPISADEKYSTDVLTNDKKKRKFTIRNNAGKVRVV